MFRIEKNSGIRRLARISLAVCLVLFIAAGAVMFQIQITKVSADVLPVLVNTNHLAFGTVFPGEKLEGEFIVTIAEGEELVEGSDSTGCGVAVSAGEIVTHGYPGSDGQVFASITGVQGYHPGTSELACKSPYLPGCFGFKVPGFVLFGPETSPESHDRLWG